MNEQISMLHILPDEDVTELKQQAEAFTEYGRKKRNWENAFQKWSDYHNFHDSINSYGKCGYGSICDYCKDNSYGRPCVRALNTMCREKKMSIDYDNYDFEEMWWR